jgi:hypothetical protein
MWTSADARSMMHTGTLTRGGNMPTELQENVDKLLNEFISEVDAITQERHLQRGVARSLLPCSLVAVLDRDQLSVVAQLRTENRASSYLYDPESSFDYRKLLNNAVWEFGFEDPFIIQFPEKLLSESPDERKAELREIAAKHIDSEFTRLQGLLNLMRTRPIYGAVTQSSGDRDALILAPPDGSSPVDQSITRAVELNGMMPNLAGDIREGKAAIRNMWLSINEARMIVADLTGPDPGVMYGLGIAHTVGKETILIRPRGTKYLTGIPKTQSLEYDTGEEGQKKLEYDLSKLIKSLIQGIYPP